MINPTIGKTYLYRTIFGNACTVKVLKKKGWFVKVQYTVRIVEFSMYDVIKIGWKPAWRLVEYEK